MSTPGKTPTAPKTVALGRSSARRILFFTEANKQMASFLNQWGQVDAEISNPNAHTIEGLNRPFVMALNVASGIVLAAPARGIWNEFEFNELFPL